MVALAATILPAGTVPIPTWYSSMMTQIYYFFLPTFPFFEWHKLFFLVKYYFYPFYFLCKLYLYLHLSNPTIQGPYYPCALVGPIVIGTAVGSLGQFFPTDKGLSAISNGLPWPIQGALMSSVFYHLTGKLFILPHE